MTDLNSRAPIARPAFRKRLLFTLGPALTFALALLGLLVGVVAYGWLTYSAQAALDIEIQAIADHIVTREGTLDAEAYVWDEPHHRFDARHIDPYFVQIFDAQAQIRRTSGNIRLFSTGMYPDRLLAYETDEDRRIQRLRTFEVEGNVLYYRTEPLHNSAGHVLGYIQVARYEPGIPGLMRGTALFLLLSFVPVLAGLLGLVWWSARRVVAPLESITAEAQAISPHRLDQRITVPAQADRETIELALTLNHQLERLEAAFEEVRRFTADAAHELQTPLTILLGHVEIALRRERQPEAYQDTLKVLHTELEGLIRMVRSLLQLARLNNEDLRLATEPVELVELIRWEATRFHKQALAEGVDLMLNLPASAWIVGQPDLIHEIVVNLLDNAVKYTTGGHVEVRVYEDEQGVVLVVEDTGVGMEEEVRRHATDRFYRAPTSDVQGISGSGLGLSLVEHMVARHGGQLILRSRPGQGTEVQVTFPARSPQSNARA